MLLNYQVVCKQQKNPKSMMITVHKQANRLTKHYVYGSHSQAFVFHITFHSKTAEQESPRAM